MAEPAGRPGLSRPQWEWLQAELAHWRAGGLITPEQEAAILARYPAPPAAGSGRTTAVVSLLGAILLGAGALLFIAHNWWQIPSLVKLGGIIALIAGAHGAGYWLWQVKGTYPRTGHALILVGCLLFGAGIWLVAQIFHLKAHWPNGLLFWALGSLPVAWALGSRPVLALGAVLLGLWSAFEQAVFGQVSWYFLPLWAALVAPPAYRLKAVETLWIGIVSTGWWVGANALEWGQGTRDWEEVALFLALGLYGAALLAVGWQHRGRADLAPLAAPYLLGGALVALVGAYALSFRWEVAWAVDQLPAWPFWTLAGCLNAVTALGAVIRMRSGSGADGWLPAAGVAAFGLALYAGVIAGGWLRDLATNLVVFGGALGAVAWGFRHQVAALVNIGLLIFVLQVITRYFDMFYSMLDRSFFFLIGGVLLLSGGWILERWRRRLLKGGAGHAG